MSSRPESDAHPNLHFRRATPGEKILCWSRNHASWGGLLTEVTQYIGREVVNSSTPMTLEGQKHWVLSTRSDQPQDGEERAIDILAACETIERPALVVGKDGRVGTVKSVGIASVFTATEMRGKGCADVMMRRLGEWLDDQGVVFSVLYSDVGKAFYDMRGGWKPFESRQVVISLKNTESSKESKTSRDVVLLDTDAVAAICAEDVAALQRNIKDCPLGRDTEFRVAVIPSFDIINWHFGSEEYTGKIVTGKKPEVKGARAGDVAITWVHDFNKSLLFVLRVSYLGIEDDQSRVNEDREEDLVGLLEAAEREAREWGFRAVVAWNPDEEMARAAEKFGTKMDGVDVVFEDRDSDNIPALRWRNEENAGKVEWWDILKYTWC